MTNEGETVLQQALNLSAVDRAELIEALFKSFDTNESSRVDALWAEEAESRIEAYQVGEIQAVPAAAVFDRIYKR